MLKAALVGLGAMGRGHLSVYQELAKEGFPVQLVAICDVDPKRFENAAVDFNLDVGGENEGLSQYRQYSDYKEMIEKEELDFIDFALPTYMHAEAAVYAMEHGLPTICEKPMALSVEQCDAMIEASKRTGKPLMIGQCLRFWEEYIVVKDLIDSGRFGKCVSADFFRGGSTPRWSFENWLLQKDKSGGCLLDQHVHDVDTINWFFGIPNAVSTTGRNVFPGSGYDAVATVYHFDDIVVTAQDDWSINGKGFGFEMTFRINFEKGAAILNREGLTLYEDDKEPVKPVEKKTNAYTNEVRYFAQCLMDGKPVTRCQPFSTRETIRIARAEMESADRGGERISP